MNMGSDGRKRGAARWLRRIVVLGVALVVNLQGWCRETVGLDRDEFYKEIEVAMDSFKDYMAHVGKGETDYENEIFMKWSTDSADSRVSVKESKIADLLLFLGNISDIDLDIDLGYARANNPLVKSMEELVEFLSEDDRYLDRSIFPSWLVYLTWYYYMEQVYLDPIYSSLTTLPDNDDEFFDNYAKTYPDSRYGRIIRIYQAACKQSSALKGYLKSPNVPWSEKQE